MQVHVCVCVNVAPFYGRGIVPRAGVRRQLTTSSSTYNKSFNIYVLSYKLAYYLIGSFRSVYLGHGYLDASASVYTQS